MKVSEDDVSGGIIAVKKICKETLGEDGEVIFHGKSFRGNIRCACQNNRIR